MRLYGYPASCNCYKVRLLLANLERPYERVPVDIFAGDTLTDEYARMNPARTTPVLETDDGRYLPESNAILVYLAQGTPYLPDDPFELAQVVRWLVYEQTDVIPTMGGLRFRLLVGRLQPSDPDAVAARRARSRSCGSSTSTSRRATSSSAAGTRPPTSRSTATATSPTRPASTWSRTRTCAPGSSGSSSSRGTSRTSSRTARTPLPARGARSTTEW
jgi:glutathione S-transferase